MRRLVERYATDWRSLCRFYDVPLSGERLRRLSRFHDEWRQRLAEVDFEALDGDGQADYLLLRNHVDHERFSLQVQEERRREVAGLLPAIEEIAELERSRRAMDHPAPELLAQRLARLADSAEESRRRIEPVDASGPSRSECHRAARALEALLPVLDSWHRHYHGYKPEYRWWTARPFRRARKALRRCLKELQSRARGGVTDGSVALLAGDPIGRSALEAALEHEMLPYGPEDLVRLGEQELEWCAREMERASVELGCGTDWRQALEHVKGCHVAVGQQDSLVASLAHEAIDFVTSRDLVTVDDLCRETWYVDMIDEEGQRTLPYQGYGGQKLLASYPTAAMGSAAALASLRSNNIHFSRAVTHHELIPGHHLQAYAAERSHTHRGIFATPFLGEGWCVYWEMLLWDLGFARGPEDRVGMLFWRMHRCARIVVSLHFHLGQMEPPEMVDYLVERLGHEREAAEGEVRRTIGDDYPPLYQCAYLIGALQLRALRRECVESGRMSDRTFHDAVLRENAIPVELIRARLLALPLARDYRPNWLFDGGVYEGRDGN